MLEGIYLPKFETGANYESKILKSDFSNLPVENKQRV